MSFDYAESLLLVGRSVSDIIATLPRTNQQPLPAPRYTASHQKCSGLRVALAVESMKQHMSDEGWQIMASLECAGYRLYGYNLVYAETNVRSILDTVNPDVIVVQDKREWDLEPTDFREKRAYFHEIGTMSSHDDIFRLTILKDAQNQPTYHATAAAEMSCHAWIVYYHPDIVAHVAPYTRRHHMIRTYHSLDPSVVPPYEERTGGALLSGALSGVYPLRERIMRERSSLPNVVYLPHPGYHRLGCATPFFLRLLAQHRLAICTVSVYGYALRKIIEATACGCRVVTDLPTDDCLPHIDGNLVRVHPAIATADLADLLVKLYTEYDPILQQKYAARAITWYNYRAIGERLAADIERLRWNYST